MNKLWPALFLDELSMRGREIAHFLLRKKYFYKTDPEKKVERFTSIMDHMTYRVSKISSLEYNIKCSSGGKERITKIFYHTPYDRHKPLLVFHHGAGMFVYMPLLNKVLGERIISRCNVVSIKAQHHENLKDYLANCMDSFENWQLTFAGSVIAMEEAIRQHRKRSDKIILATGVSMGGIVTSLHFLLHNTADYYVPIIAYPNVGEIFLGKAYRHAVDRLEVRRRNKSYYDSFRFDSIASDTSIKKVFPILARNDWYIDFGKASEFWRGYNVKTFDTGHRSIVAVIPEIMGKLEKLILP